MQTALLSRYQNTPAGITVATDEVAVWYGQGQEGEGWLFVGTGTRVIMRIPAGVNGYDHSQSTTVERWYSPDLKTVLLIERSDPRFGIIRSRLYAIQRNAPAPALFTVPSGFKITPK